MDTYQSQMIEHLKIPEAKRDQAWELRLLDLVPNAKMSVLSPEPQEGPDGMSYLLVSTDRKSTEPAQKIFSWLSDKGIGLVLNPDKEYPDYVFTYGMIWNFKERSLFIQNPPQSPPNNTDNLITGEPTKDYLPEYSRSLLKQFLLDQGVYKPRILMVGKNEESMDLVFSIESFGSPPEEEHKGILEAISWFLPNHYSLAFAKTEGLPEFFEL